jgi:hypothetical protein
MKVNTQKRDIQSGGLIGRKNFTVQAGAHIMAVLSGLYTKPVHAMVREYLTNMYDAVAALRRKHPKAEILPAVLSLPTSLSPELVFKDFGIGMSCETVMDIYSQYGNSTKNDSNLEVGGFGLGSKTAFCYNNGSTWTIESRYEGKKHIFMASIGEEGIPFLAHVSSADTDEHSGVTIRIPILRTDVGECYEAAEEYVPYFTLPLTVEGDRRIEEITKKVEYTVRGDTWGIRKAANQYHSGREWRIVMGNVPYDINWYDLKLPGSYSDFYGNDFDLFVPIGSVDIVPSRDALKMTDRTRATILAAIKGVVAELQVMLTTQIQSAPTYWDALVAYTNLNTVRGAKDVVTGVKWNGKEIDTMKGVVAKLADLHKIDPTATVIQYGVVDHDRSTIEATALTKATDELRLRADHTWLVIEDMNKGVARVKSHLYEKLVNHTSHNGKNRTQRYGHTIGHALMVKTTATPAQLTTLFGGYPASRMMKVSDLKVGKLPPSQKSSVDTIYRWNGSSWDARVNIPTGKKYYLVLEKSSYSGRFVWTNTKDGYEAKRQTIGLIDYARQLGIHTDVGNLYGVKKDEVSKVDATQFTDLYEAIQTAAIAKATKEARSWALSPTLNVQLHTEATWLTMFTKLGVPTVADPNFQKLAAALKERQSERQGATHLLLRKNEYLTVATLTAIKAITDGVVIEDVSAITTKYPLLAVFIDLLNGAGYQYRADDAITRHKKVLLDFWNAPR